MGGRPGRPRPCRHGPAGALDDISRSLSRCDHPSWVPHLPAVYAGLFYHFSRPAIMVAATKRFRIAGKESRVMSAALPYVPMDRRQALAHGETLPNLAAGSVLSADISGFTALTEELARVWGARRGAEELARHLNAIYDALIAQI